MQFSLMLIVSLLLNPVTTEVVVKVVELVMSSAIRYECEEVVEARALIVVGVIWVYALKDEDTASIPNRDTEAVIHIQCVEVAERLVWYQPRDEIEGDRVRNANDVSTGCS